MITKYLKEGSHLSPLTVTSFNNPADNNDNGNPF